MTELDDFTEPTVEYRVQPDGSPTDIDDEPTVPQFMPALSRELFDPSTLDPAPPRIDRPEPAPLWWVLAATTATGLTLAIAVLATALAIGV